MEIPAPFAALKVSYVKRRSANEYSSSCPRCGGERHEDGEFPDRFRMFIKSKATGKPLGWCRACNYVWLPEKLTPEREKVWEAEKAEIEAEQRTTAELKIALLQQSKVWERYHESLNGTYREYYYLRGLSDFWIDYWLLGYNPEKTFWADGEEFVSPALTIPVFTPGQEQPVNIRNRILKPKNPMDKYRPEFGGLPASIYYTDRDTKPKGRVLLVEGEFKAMTVFITLGDLSYYVIGIPGKTPALELLSPLADCEIVYLLLDPDAHFPNGTERVSAVSRLATFFKERARIIQTPDKIDDMILAGHMDKSGLLHLIKNAKRTV